MPISKRIRNRIASQTGITLIEVLVSVAILGIIAIPFSNMFIAAVRNNHETEKRIEAYALANQEMERLKSNTSGTGNSSLVRGNFTVSYSITREPTPTPTAVTTPTPTPPECQFDISDSSERVYTISSGGEVDEEVGGLLQVPREYSSSGNYSLMLNVALDEAASNASIAIVNSSSQLVTLYIQNDIYNKLKVTVGRGQVNVIKNISSQAVSHSGRNMVNLRIDIEVRDNQDNSLLAELSSFKAQYD